MTRKPIFEQRLDVIALLNAVQEWCEGSFREEVSAAEVLKMFEAKTAEPMTVAFVAAANKLRRISAALYHRENDAHAITLIEEILDGR